MSWLSTWVHWHYVRNCFEKEILYPQFLIWKIPLPKKIVNVTKNGQVPIYLFHIGHRKLGEPSLKKTGKFGKNSQRGGVWKNRRKFPISIWEFWKPRGGSQFFKNVWISIILQLFCNITFIRNVWNSKSSEFDPRGGVGSFQKVLKFKKFWIIRGGGVKPNWEFFPNFPVFF